MEIHINSIDTEIDVPIDYTSYGGHVYLLYPEEVIIADKTGIMENFGFQTDSKPTTIHCDNLGIYIGFADGRITLYQSQKPYNPQFTTRRDVGPGKPGVTHLYSDTEKLIVHTIDNGLHVYDKDEKLDWMRWIMIGGHTTIIHSTIYGELLYLILDNMDIHMLAFQLGRLIPVTLKTRQYTDIEFDGKILYLSIDRAIYAHNTELDYKQIWKKVFDRGTVVNNIIRLNDYLFVGFNSGDWSLYEIDNYELVETGNINHPQLYEEINVNYHRFEPENLEKFSVLWYKGKTIYWASIEL